MSDEQTELLKQILDVQRETLAFAKQQHEQFLVLQQTALADQKKGLGMSRFVLAFMLIMVGLCVFIAVSRATRQEASTTRSPDAPAEIESR